MVEQVYPNIFRIEIPLPQNPLRALNSWFIRGEQRNLLVDSGFNRIECKKAMDEGLQALGVDMYYTDLLATHVHSDHAGLSGYLARPDNFLYMSENDAELVKMNASHESNWQGFHAFIYYSGLVSEGLEVALDRHPGYRYAPDGLPTLKLVEDGDLIAMGTFNWRVISTPGHTPGHISIYEPEHKILIAGDHILASITPNITTWDIELDSLGQYLESLKKIELLDIELVLPGHRQIITDCSTRIKELQLHHADRLQDVLNIIGTERKNAVQVARYMRWDLSYKDWDQFPWGQKLFATGEAMAHLLHLEAQGILQREWEGDICYFETYPPGAGISG